MPTLDCEQTIAVDQVLHHFKRKHAGDTPDWPTPAPQVPVLSRNLPDLPDIVPVFELDQGLVVLPASNSRQVAKACSPILDMFLMRLIG